MAAQKTGEKMRMIDIGENEMWTDFLEKANDLLLEEKGIRQEADHIKQSEICLRIIEFAWDSREFARLRQLVILLVKRRGQAKKAVTDMVQKCINEYLDKVPSREEKYALLKTLREASEGKLFLEKEYSDCTVWLCNMLEEDGNAEEATKIIQEIQIETFGSLEVKDKVNFILYQMKLVLGRRDFVRCQILSKKISRKHLNEAGLESQKIQFYRFMVQYYIHEKMHLDVGKSFQVIYDTYNKSEQNLDASGDQKAKSFQNFVFFLLLSPYNNERVDLQNIVEKNYPRELEQNELIGKFLKKLQTYEIMPLNMEEVEQSLRNYEPFQPSTENNELHLREFIKQLIQHNIRVIEKYYSRVKLQRLAYLVGVGVDRAEAEIGDMVVNNRLHAKINRMQGVVVFQKSKFTNDILNDWNYDLRTLLDKIEQTCHLINRENVVHN